MFSFLLHKYPEVGLPGCTVRLILQETANVFSKVAVNLTLCLQHIRITAAPYRHEYLVLSVISIFHYSFNLHFFDEYWCWASFHVLVGHLHIFFVKYVFKYFAHILGYNFFIRCIFCMYLLPVCHLLFMILVVLFWKAEVFILIKFVTSNFGFRLCGFCVPRNLCRLKVTMILSYLFFKNVIILDFTFRSTIYFDLTFVYHVKCRHLLFSSWICSFETS